MADEDKPVGPEILDWLAAGELKLRRKLLTAKGLAWVIPAKVFTVRRMTNGERLAAEVPVRWGVALRVRIAGDETLAICGDPPLPDWLAAMLED